MVRRHRSAVLLLRVVMGIKIFRDDNWIRIRCGDISRRDIICLGTPFPEMEGNVISDLTAIAIGQKMKIIVLI